jgi:hypothetical protein
MASPQQRKKRRILQARRVAAKKLAEAATPKTVAPTKEVVVEKKVEVSKEAPQELPEVAVAKPQPRPAKKRSTLDKKPKESSKGTKKKSD